MQKKFLILCVILSLFSLNKTNAQYELNKNYPGISGGLSFLGSSLQVGLNYEYSFELKDVGSVGAGAIFRYFSYDEKYVQGKWTYSNTILGAQGNYHFNVEDKRFDPFAGLILGFNASSTKWNGPGADWFSVQNNSGLWIAAQGGLRYWISPKVGITGRIGFGNLSYGMLDIGVDVKF